MLTRLRIRNFKRFAEADVELGKAAVLVGPNNSGKTTALQALALWEIGLKRWSEKRQGDDLPKQRPGVTINRRDLVAIPVPFANLLWRDLHVQSGRRAGKNGRSQAGTQKVRMEIIVDGVTAGRAWTCGLEFDYANEESFYCRPLRVSSSEERMPIPEEATRARVAFLPPMSGLADREYVKQPGEIGVLIGQGQTAQVLRNLCYQISSKPGSGDWARLVEHLHELFGVKLLAPEYIAERSEITMQYEDQGGSRLDLSSSGRGLQQTLLLLAHLYANPGTVLLLDEPDAHLEILRQRQTYKLLTEVASRQGSQVVAASHSEVVLNEAAGRDVVVAFVGKPHRLGERDRGSQVLKALREIGFDKYYQAEQAGWVLYLEGSTDLAILQAFAKVLGHGAATVLERPFVEYVGNDWQRACSHIFGLREAKPDLAGCVLLDRRDAPAEDHPGLKTLVWRRREIENYFCMEEVLLAYAEHKQADDLFGPAEGKAMRETIAEISRALRDLRKPDPWSPDAKVTDDFLDPLFDKYFEKLGLPNLLRKSGYHALAVLVPPDRLDPEVHEKLDAILQVAGQARPVGD